MSESKVSVPQLRWVLKLSFAIALVAAVALAWGGPVAAGTPAAAPLSQAPGGRVFGSDAGMILNAIKADKTADFELVVARLKDALQKSPNADRKRQAAGWRVFKAVERGANDSAIYVFWIDPPVKDADYTVSKILMEAFPGEAQELYKKFSDSYVNGQSVINLQLFARMGE